MKPAQAPLSPVPVVAEVVAAPPVPVVDDVDVVSPLLAMAEVVLPPDPLLVLADSTVPPQANEVNTRDGIPRINADFMR